MMKKILIPLLVLFLANCSSVDPSAYKDKEPKLVLEKYFEGVTSGWGLVLDRNEEVIKRFIVKIDGTFTDNGKKGKLVEDFVWSDGKTERRVWFLEKEKDKNWTGKADGVIGSAEGIVSGNSLNWKYAFNLVLEDSVVENLEVTFNDWMFLINDNVLMNRATFSKFGINLGTVIITFKKDNLDK